MADSPSSSSSLELTISFPGLASPSPRPSSGDQGVKDLDINEKPAEEDEWRMGATLEEDIEEGRHSNRGSAGGPPRKKLRLTKEQSHLLEESFRQNHTLNPKQKQELALQLKLRPRQVEVWFQNRRARSKLKQTEMECDYLKRWFGTLTEQNRRLQRELEELRAFKVVNPSTSLFSLSTLTMCPRCERVTSTTAAVTVALDKGGPTASQGESLGSQSRRPPSSPAS